MPEDVIKANFPVMVQL